MSTEAKGPGSYSSTAGGGAVDWTNQSNAGAEDGSLAVCSQFSAGQQSYQFWLTNFGFALSGASAVLGIQVRVKKKQVSNMPGFMPCDFRDLVLQLLKDNSGAPALTGNNKADTATTWVEGTLTDSNYGAANDVWGATLSISDVKHANFGVCISGKDQGGFGGAGDADIDYVEITVTYTTGDGNLVAETQTVRRRLKRPIYHW